MHFVEREFVMERLHVSLSKSYVLVRGNALHRVSTDTVITLLNATRRSGEPSVDHIPGDILTPEQVECETGIPAASIVRWTRTRTRHVPPHFRLSRNLTRFRRSTLLKWLERESHV